MKSKKKIFSASSFIADEPMDIVIPILTNCDNDEDFTEGIDKLESEGDHVFRGELAYLFEYVKDPIELIKWKDLLEGLEDTLDHCERMADLLKGVVMKYA